MTLNELIKKRNGIISNGSKMVSNAWVQEIVEDVIRETAQATIEAVRPKTFIPINYEVKEYWNSAVENFDRKAKEFLGEKEEK